jgi:hypothetical protein
LYDVKRIGMRIGNDDAHTKYKENQKNQILLHTPSNDDVISFKPTSQSCLTGF